MSYQKSNTSVVSYADFFALDFKKLPTEVLKTIRLQISTELHKRKATDSSDTKIMQSAFAGLPNPSQEINSKASRYLENLLSQDWSNLFTSNDMERKYYVYAHVKPSKSRIRIDDPVLSLRFKGYPFYIGKGCGGRAFDLKRNQGHGVLLKDLIDESVTASEIVHFVKKDLTEAEALELESKLIYFFGTRYEKDRKGLLVNLDIPPRPDFISWKKWVSLNKNNHTVHPA